ncbi:MAG: PCP reductase family protein [Longimicrobiales bacterium]
MAFAERDLPGDGTMAAVFTCGSCGREVAMLTNPMETQLVASLGVKVGGSTLPEQPFELVRTSIATGGDVFQDAMPDAAHDVPRGTTGSAAAGDEDTAAARTRVPARVTWSDDAIDRLARVPSFVRGMVKRIYTDYAQENGIGTITTDVMDRARTDLGLEGM